MMERFDKKSAETLSREVQNELAELCKEKGISCAPGAVRYGETSVSITLEFVTVGGLSHEAQTFKALAAQYELPANALGEAFEIAGTMFRISGLVPKRHRFPISAVRVSDGRAYKFTANQVRSALQMKGRKW